ncbi:mannosyl-3-phosphoglycerate phosphatase [Thermococcus sp. M39]|uniref:mannosyl-3-phosphoglycerate phosphatase n=1 Tax=unclassified Thermococcus TaxID=2627626 RepID=UPI0014388BDB|nr:MULTISPECIES: mannosyl-3-phosphoglycerate phosphatase [unclassified Thermococcus]NJE07129.1 mannosyl-3-phosphoglycerate phosphatase [Thermococcus sp. M39]NJE13739.1 mannosyl-3-phosphoglycerate phosphatase [Thermococcus sp. LS2]
MRVIFLDLDRTLIGDDYSPEPAKAVVNELKRRGFGIIFNSSKTRAEQEYYRKALNVEDPFIVETGSAIYIPKKYFPFSFNFTREVGEYFVIELGEKYGAIKKVLDDLSEEFGLKYYGNSSIEEVMEFTGLPRHLAELAMMREYSETIFRWKSEKFIEAIKSKGLKVSKGSRFYNVHGNTDKGKAAYILLLLYSKFFGDIESYAVGDGLNDFPLFDVVDKAFIIGNLKHPNAVNISSIEELLEVIK